MSWIPGSLRVHAVLPLRGSDPREIDGYALTGRLGAGGFGVVYAATTPDGREVALKVLRPELSDDEGLRARLAREAEALRSVRGDRNVQVLDVVTEGGFIADGAAVEVLAVHGNRIVVHERAD